MAPPDSKPANTNPVPESKSAKKKKAKAEIAQTQQPPPTSTESETGARHDSADAALNGADGNNESPYIKELQKNIRNIKKKLNATQKVDSIIAENPGVSLDDLISQKKINYDQKAQAEKKPSLKASLSQLEEQVKHYQQFDEDYQKRLAVEKSLLESSHKDELQKVKDAVAAEAAATSEKESKDKLLILSKFLRAAAAKRQGGDENSAENRAFEGALLLVYGGEAGAVVAMESLISGVDEKVPTVDQNVSEFTYKQVRDLAVEYAPYAVEEAWAEEVAKSEPIPPGTEESVTAVGTDPTVAHAGLTELDAQGSVHPIDATHHVEKSDVPPGSSIDTSAANNAGANNWDPKASVSAESGPDGWVKVPRDLAETDTGNQATPAAAHGTQSWADEVQAEPTQAMPEPEYIKPPVNGDGFSEVNRHRGGRARGDRGEQRGRGRGGGFRGDRNDGGGRGRGYRGDRRGEGGERGRGRGGGFRGDRGGNRGRGEVQQAS